MTISQSIFKAYDIRGIVNQDLSTDTVKLIGLAIGSESIAKGERGIVLGRDGRLSGIELMHALQAGLNRVGVILLILAWFQHHSYIMPLTPKGQPQE